MSAARTFLVGETVALSVKVSQPGSRTPANPTDGVRLVALSKRSGSADMLPPNTHFALQSDGFYSLSLATGALPAGTYDWRALAADDNGQITLAEDSFVLWPTQAVVSTSS